MKVSTPTDTLLKFSKSQPDQVDRKFISSTVVPVEVFVILLTQSGRKFTVNDLIFVFQQLHKIELTFPRMQQILNDLVSAGKATTHQARNKKNNLVNYYTFKTVL